MEYLVLQDNLGSRESVESGEIKDNRDQLVTQVQGDAQESKAMMDRRACQELRDLQEIKETEA